jgi:hypothetical protein
MATSKPTNTIRSGSIKATIWENRGKNGNFFQATFSRPFKDEKGNWNNGSSFGLKDLENLLNAALEAREWINAQH